MFERDGRACITSSNKTAWLAPLLPQYQLIKSGKNRWLSHLSCKTAPAVSRKLHAFLFSWLSSWWKYLEEFPRLWGLLSSSFAEKQESKELPRPSYWIPLSKEISCLVTLSTLNKQNKKKKLQMELNSTSYYFKKFEFHSCLFSSLYCSTMEPVLLAFYQCSWQCISPDAKLWIFIFFPWPL